MSSPSSNNNSNNYTNNKPKPNQPCPCGSGRKFKKCCFLVLITTSESNKQGDTKDCEGAECSPTSKCTYDENTTSCYRFKIGDRVEANVGIGKGKTFRAGTIVAVDYYERGWLGSVPYQICLDGCGNGSVSKYIYAPFDDDDCVRAAPPPVVIPTTTSTPANKRRLRPSATSHCSNNIRERVTS